MEARIVGILHATGGTELGRRMTQADINRMKLADGCYLCSNADLPSYGILVGVSAGRLHGMRCGSRLSEDASTWSPGMQLLAGPITIETQRALDEKAAQVEILVRNLEAECDAYISLIASMKPFVRTFAEKFGNEHAARVMAEIERFPRLKTETLYADE